MDINDEICVISIDNIIDNSMCVFHGRLRLQPTGQLLLFDLM